MCAKGCLYNATTLEIELQVDNEHTGGQVNDSNL